MRHSLSALTSAHVDTRPYNAAPNPLCGTTPTLFGTCTHPACTSPSKWLLPQQIGKELNQAGPYLAPPLRAPVCESAVKVARFLCVWGRPYLQILIRWNNPAPQLSPVFVRLGMRESNEINSRTRIIRKSSEGPMAPLTRLPF